MIPEELSKLTPKQKRIEIAKANGWQEPIEARFRQCDGQACVDVDQLPDYLNDLNAMHIAEKTISHDGVRIYIDALWNIVGNTTAPMRDFNSDQVGAFMWRVHTATAAQRADAFLLTLFS